MIVRLQIVFFSLVAFVQSASAANHYLRAGAHGSGTGVNWNNACTGFTGSCAVAGLVRGDTYYVAGGTYAGYQFDTVNAGTSFITIKAATISDHGTSAGWSNSYSVETAQAHFGAISFPTSSYWVFDGVVGSQSSSASAYGFQIDEPATCTSPQTAIQIGQSGTAGIHDLVFRHIAFQACPDDIQKIAITDVPQTHQISNITISYCLFDGWQGAIASASQNTNSGYTFEYNYLVNHFSSAAHPGTWISSNGSASDWIVRFNTFDDCTLSGCNPNGPILIIAAYRNAQQALSLRLLDVSGNPIPNVPVTFAASAGSGSITPASAMTDASGQVTATAILGTGLNVYTATVNRTPVKFSIAGKTRRLGQITSQD
jgi:hypothetical protein